MSCDQYPVVNEDVMLSKIVMEIKARFRSWYHPDENANDVKAANVFKEVTFSYNILSDSDKRRQYYTSGFEVNLSELSLVYEILTTVESERQELEVELDLSSLGTVNTMFAAIFSKLGVPIKSTISATVLEEALNGAVEKQCAHFYSIAITEKGSACRIFFAEFIHQTSKFKVHKFLWIKTLQEGNLRSVEAQILTKRVELSKFETEYREVLAQLTEMTSRYAQEMQAVSNFLEK
ncbi:hypothetical protein ACS0TY_006622 [Phlomoides rotata]